MKWLLKPTGWMAIAGSLLCLGGSASAAAPTVSLTQTVDATHPTLTSVNVTAGQSFTVNLGLSAPSPLTWTSNPAATYGGFDGMSVYLQASASGFSVNSELPSLTGGSNPLNFANYSGTFPMSLPTAGNSSDLGYVTNTVSPNVAPGSYAIAAITFSTSAGLAPGNYTLVTTSSTDISDAAGDEYDGIAPATYSVTIVPEPSSFFMIGAIGAAGLMFRRRRAR